jgi:hypothetical protein
MHSLDEKASSHKKLYLSDKKEKIVHLCTKKIIYVQIFTL